MTIVATGLAYSSGNRIDIRSASGVLYSTTTPGTYTFTKNQFASPITSVALMSYNASGSSISIELK